MMGYWIAEYQCPRPSDGLDTTAFVLDLEDREGMWRPGITGAGVGRERLSSQAHRVESGDSMDESTLSEGDL